MAKENEYTITIFTENKVGMLSRVVSVFTRRHINIESIGASESSIKDVYKYIIVVKVEEVLVKKLVAQLDKQVDIIKSFYYEEHEIVQQELALYKVPTKTFLGGDKTEELVRKHNARILSIEDEYIVIEKTGLKSETEALLVDLRKNGEVYEFVRSGRIAIIKPMERLNTYLKGMDVMLEDVRH
ncbi:MAG: acetolactate synthase-1/3 small subunit [Maribacter sp.]|jgi:acetolactate synthase-1/3 small subunit